IAADQLLREENDLYYEENWYDFFKQNNTPVLFVINKTDIYDDNVEELKIKFFEKFRKSIDSDMVVGVSCAKGNVIGQYHNTDSIRKVLARMLPESFEAPFITGNLVNEDDVVLLVMPQDIQAPKGRLILPQVQTIRELLDRKCTVISATTDKMLNALEALKKPPKLIITDSQVFDFVYKNKPSETMLTSFSVLFAAYKGDIKYYLQGAKAIDSLTENSRVLIAECCTHAPLSEDIGREKIPKLLRKRVGQGLAIDIVGGTDFPDKPDNYDLIIQCGACMFNRKYVLSRIETAKRYNVPMTNYGVTIAHITGILDKIATI
ncbi:MAG: [Lachnospiraceae bacterium]|nr:[FeFe] hydrogenase H-cluster maturation GTPase HydF [Lachnospiraceae bacterium]